MKLTLVLLFCISASRAIDFDYDEEESESEMPKAEVGEGKTNPRGHRPDSSGTYQPSRTQTATGKFERNAFKSRTASSSIKDAVIRQKIYHDLKGCKHLSVNWGGLCPNGCELRTSLLKEQSNMQLTIERLRQNVSNLLTNNIHKDLEMADHQIQQKQYLYTGNNQTVETYKTELENRFALIKHAIKTMLPSTLRRMYHLVNGFTDKLEKLEEAITNQSGYCADRCTVSCNIPVVSGKDCDDIYNKGGRTSQLYVIQPDSFTDPYKVYCDMTTKQGGWTLIQNRQDGSVHFGRSWDAYKNGFGNIAFDVGKGFCDTPGEYWLGNDRISQLTKSKPTMLFFEMQDWKDNKLTAQYDKFEVQSEVNKYRLSVDGYTGMAGNTLMEGAKTLFGDNRTMTIHQNMMFSTYDRDNDEWSDGQCAREDGGGWWYNRCHSSNPNGRYYWGGEYTKEMTNHGTDDGIVWMDWKGSWYSIKKMSMKIGPRFTATYSEQEQIPQAFYDYK
ncbi:fibrinogen beta chain [Heterodontus francisci]|uniref:fibrinogen beta chain n=1 Tax=Heterodontus francisci TaxID=7792 RepID=UPI00355BD426